MLPALRPDSVPVFPVQIAYSGWPHPLWCALSGDFSFASLPGPLGYGPDVASARLGAFRGSTERDSDRIDVVTAGKAMICRPHVTHPWVISNFSVASCDPSRSQQTKQHGLFGA